MKEIYMKNNKKENQYLNVKKNEIIGINYFEDELMFEFNKKRNNPDSLVPGNAIPKFIDVNVSEDNDTINNYLYNPILNIKTDDEVFELTELILKKTHDNIPGSKMLLNALIFFVVNFRPEEERNLISVMKLLRLVYSPNKHNEDEMGFDYWMNIIKKDHPDSMASILYSGFKVLDKNEQLRIAVLLYEILLPFQLKKYNNFNVPIMSYLNLKENEFPCYMLYLDDYENNVQDRILANIFAIQNKNINKI